MNDVCMFTASGVTEATMDGWGVDLIAIISEHLLQIGWSPEGIVSWGVGRETASGKNYGEKLHISTIGSDNFITNHKNLFLNQGSKIKPRQLNYQELLAGEWVKTLHMQLKALTPACYRDNRNALFHKTYEAQVHNLDHAILTKKIKWSSFSLACFNTAMLSDKSCTSSSIQQWWFMRANLKEVSSTDLWTHCEKC